MAPRCRECSKNFSDSLHPLRMQGLHLLFAFPFLHISWVPREKPTKHLQWIYSRYPTFTTQSSRGITPSPTTMTTAQAIPITPVVLSLVPLPSLSHLYGPSPCTSCWSASHRRLCACHQHLANCVRNPRQHGSQTLGISLAWSHYPRYHTVRPPARARPLSWNNSSTGQTE